MLVSSSLQLGPLHALQLTWPCPIVACAIDCFCCWFWCCFVELLCLWLLTRLFPNSVLALRGSQTDRQIPCLHHLYTMHLTCLPLYIHIYTLSELRLQALSTYVSVSSSVNYSPLNMPAVWLCGFGGLVLLWCCGFVALVALFCYGFVALVA